MTVPTSSKKKIEEPRKFSWAPLFPSTTKINSVVLGRKKEMFAVEYSDRQILYKYRAKFAPEVLRNILGEFDREGFSLQKKGRTLFILSHCSRNGVIFQEELIEDILLGETPESLKIFCCHPAALVHRKPTWRDFLINSFCWEEQEFYPNKSGDVILGQKITNLSPLPKGIPIYLPHLNWWEQITNLPLI